MEVAKNMCTILVVALLIWMMVSWADVIFHNNPSENDGSPSSWNAFVVLTEVGE